MKPFNLQEALAGKPVITRDGQKVLGIVHLPFSSNHYKVAVQIEGFTGPTLATEDGVFFPGARGHGNDLFMQSEKKSGWVNIYHQAGGYSNTGSVIFATQEEAKARMTHAIAQAKIEWEE